MAVIKRSHSGTRDIQPSNRELEHGIFARNAAAEGFVLLKNDGLLPLTLSAPVALFGKGAVQTVKGGTGSGDVNNRKNISIYEGLKDAGAEITNEDWIADYRKRYEAARAVWKEKVLEDVRHTENPFDAYSANPFSLPEGREITRTDAGNAPAGVVVVDVEYRPACE